VDLGLTSPRKRGKGEAPTPKCCQPDACPEGAAPPAILRESGQFCLTPQTGGGGAVAIWDYLRLA